jgi:hypothetical protein
MSTPFYDLASLVVVPSGVKAQKVYAQKPMTTDGQLTFSRASTATRVNASGLIEDRCQQRTAFGLPGRYLRAAPTFGTPADKRGLSSNAAYNAVGLASSNVTANACNFPDGTANADGIMNQ